MKERRSIIKGSFVEFFIYEEDPNGLRVGSGREQMDYGGVLMNKPTKATLSENGTKLRFRDVKRFACATFRTSPSASLSDDLFVGVSLLVQTLNRAVYVGDNDSEDIRRRQPTCLCTITAVYVKEAAVPSRSTR